MIHYTCDLCRRTVRQTEVRYVVKMDVFPAQPEPAAESNDSDVDHLEALSDFIDQLGDDEASDVGEGPQELRFDLCVDCHRRFRKDPLGRELLLKPMNFSSN